MRPAALLRSAAPLSAVTAGFVTILVGVTSSAAVVITAARAAGADQAELASWMCALGIGLGVTGIGLSLRYRAPVVTAWSTPGAALLATGLVGVPMSKAVGAFIVSSVLILLSGATGWFARVMASIPLSLASALLAGVLLEFGTGLFREMHGGFAVTFPVFAAYLLARRLVPRYAVLAGLLAGIVAAALAGRFDAVSVSLAPAAPVWTTPRFDPRIALGVGVPLFVVTMASQNLPGIAVLRGNGYDVPVSPLIGWTGAANLVLAPFGAFGLNLAAITAAICAGEDAHPDRNRRYVAAVWAGGCYLVVLGVFGGAVGTLLTAMPQEVVLGVAGVGLLATIGGALHNALADDGGREAAVVAFLATASGMTLLGIGSAFWGLAAGVLTLLVTRTRPGWPARRRGAKAAGGDPAAAPAVPPAADADAGIGRAAVDPAAGEGTAREPRTEAVDPR